MTRSGEPDAATTYRPRQPIDLRFALMGAKSVTSIQGVRWWTTVTPAGPASVAFRPATDGTIRADSWGPGTEWALTQLPRLLGAHDDSVDDFWVFDQDPPAGAGQRALVPLRAKPPQRQLGP